MTATTAGALTTSVTAAATYRASTVAHPRAGRYTLVLPANPQLAASDMPQGNGYGVLTINTKGRFTFSGRLVDGTPVSTTAQMVGNDHVDIYKSLYTARGFLAGVAVVRDSGVSDFDGMLHWSKPALPKARIHPEPLQADIPVIGSRYTAPIKGAPVFSLTSGTESSAITLAEGNLAEPIVQSVTLGVAGQLVANRAPVPAVKAVLNPTNGVFSGSFMHPMTGKATAFRGVIFQKQNAGYGFFLGVDQSGTASLTPAN